MIGLEEEITKDDLLGVIPFKGSSQGNVSAFVRVRAQRKIFEKFGAKGVAVYSSIDGKKSVEEIRAELNMSPENIVEILEFMESTGMVTLKTIFELEAEKAQL